MLKGRVVVAKSFEIVPELPIRERSRAASGAENTRSSGGSSLPVEIVGILNVLGSDLLHVLLAGQKMLRAQ